MVIVPSTRAGGPVAHLEDVRHGVLREPAHARREEEDQRDADPCARRLPQRADPDTIAEPGSAEQAARADPGREQREHEHVRRQRPAGDQEVVAAAGRRRSCGSATPRPPRAQRGSREPRPGRATWRANVTRHRARSAGRGSRLDTLADSPHAAPADLRTPNRDRAYAVFTAFRRLCSYAMADPIAPAVEHAAPPARPRVLRSSPRPLDAVLHRDVGALQLLRHAGAPDPVHDRAGGDRRPRVRHGGRGRGLRPLHLDGVHEHAARRLARRPRHRPAPRGALRRHPDRQRPLQHGVPVARHVLSRPVPDRHRHRAAQGQRQRASSDSSMDRGTRAAMPGSRSSIWGSISGRSSRR